MKKALIWGAGLALLVVACSKGSNSPEGMMQETLGLMNDMTSTLASIKDEASAKAAIPKLQELANKGEDIKKRAEAMKTSNKLTKEDEEALKKKYEPQLKEATEKLMKETFRVATVPGAADAMKAMQPKKG
jgi:hypothetical protein